MTLDEAPIGGVIPRHEQHGRPYGANGAGRRILACASSGGHFKQLVSLVSRLPDVGNVTWVTYDRGLSADLLATVGREHDQLVFAPYAAPRDLANLARNARVIRALLRADHYDLAISTGAGIAVASLPLTRARGIRSCFVESATRVEGPSMSGRMLERVPGVELCTQNDTMGRGGYGRRWRLVGSVHDEFAPGPLREVAAVRRVVVSLGTIQPYGFRRLLDRLLKVLPTDAQILWQTGATDVAGLPLDGHRTVSGPEFEAAVAAADVVVAHAGTGTAVTAFELGRCPVLVPRRQMFGEHVDDHQVATAVALAARGLAMHTEVDELDLAVLRSAARRSVIRRDHPPPWKL